MSSKCYQNQYCWVADMSNPGDTHTNLCFAFLSPGPSSFHSPLAIPLKERESSTVRWLSVSCVSLSCLLCLVIRCLYIDDSPLFNRNSCADTHTHTHCCSHRGISWLNQIITSGQISQCHLIQVENDSNHWARISSQQPPLISAQLKATLTLLLFIPNHLKGFTGCMCPLPGSLHPLLSTCLLFFC